MLLIHGLHNLKSQFSNTVVTIGNYDGVHLGHQEILKMLVQKAHELRVPSVVVVFEPQPNEFFGADKLLRLTNLREKISLFTQYGIDAVLVLKFNAKLAATSGKEFIENILLQSLHIKYLIVGDDFVFGCKGTGDFKLLEKYAAGHDLQVRQLPSFKVHGIRVSSSLIRAALLRGDLKNAAELLGRSYQVSGRVVHGDHIGHSLGFPTANINLARRELPFTGVFAVKVYGLRNEILCGVANIGFRPTFFGKKKSFEVYIFNFNSDIYGKVITVEFCEKIRDEQKFASLDALKIQIKKDIARVKQILGT